MKLLIQREYIICRWIDNGCTAIIAQWIGLTVLKLSSMLLRPTSRRKVSCSVHAVFAEIKRSSQKKTYSTCPPFLEGFHGLLYSLDQAR